MRLRDRSHASEGSQIISREIARRKTGPMDDFAPHNLIHPENRQANRMQRCSNRRLSKPTPI